MPAGAIPDKYDMVFVYEKNGEKKDFKVDALPDSTWTFVDRKQTLVEKGKNNIPVIYTNIYNLPVREDDPYDSLFEAPSKMLQAGIKFCISTGDGGAVVWRPRGS